MDDCMPGKLDIRGGFGTKRVYHLGLDAFFEWLGQEAAARRCAAPELTSRTCSAIVQPRRAAYSRRARLCVDRVCGSPVDTRAYRPARNIFTGFRAWPKTLSDFTVGKAPFPLFSCDVSGRPESIIAGPPRPGGRKTDVTNSGQAELCRLAGTSRGGPHDGRPPAQLSALQQFARLVARVVTTKVRPCPSWPLIPRSRAS